MLNKECRNALKTLICKDIDNEDLGINELRKTINYTLYLCDTLDKKGLFLKDILNNENK